LLADDDELPVEALPPALTGDELARRAGIVSERSTRRTA
jgi:hypothetical protein